MVSSAERNTMVQKNQQHIELFFIDLKLIAAYAYLHNRKQTVHNSFTWANITVNILNDTIFMNKLVIKPDSVHFYVRVLYSLSAINWSGQVLAPKLGLGYEKHFII